MTINEILDLSPVIPVLDFRSSEEAVDVCRALFEAGIMVHEITLRHESALDAIAAVRASLPDAVIGAGTIMNAGLLEDAIDAGAQFGVSPGLTADLAGAVRETGLPFLPGVATISEAMTASHNGFRALKFFPASVSGGPEFLKAAGAVLKNIVFCPTGGINEKTAHEYLSVENVKAVGGSWLTKRDGSGQIDLEGVREKSVRAVSLFYRP